MKIAQVFLPALLLLVLLTYACARANEEYAVGPVVRQDEDVEEDDGDDMDGMDFNDGDADVTTTPDVVAPVTPDVVAPVTPDVVAPVTPDVVAPVTPDVVSPLPVGGACAAAEAACLLGFAGTEGLQTFSVPQPPNTPFTPSIVSKDPSVRIGIVNSNIEGEFITSVGTPVFFSALSIPGVQPFSPSFFKPVAMMDGRTSGIAHESLQAGQAALAPGNCVRVFITEWQVLSASGEVIDNINGVTDRSQNVCVVFQTSA